MPYDSLESTHKHFSIWCKQRYSIALGALHYSLFAVPHLGRISELLDDNKQLARQLFDRFKKIVEFTHSVFEAFNSQNSVCQINLGSIRATELTPALYERAREDVAPRFNRTFPFQLPIVASITGRC